MPDSRTYPRTTTPALSAKFEIQGTWPNGLGKKVPMFDVWNPMEPKSDTPSGLLLDLIVLSRRIPLALVPGALSAQIDRKRSPMSHKTTSRPGALVVVGQVCGAAGRRRLVCLRGACQRRLLWFSVLFLGGQKVAVVVVVLVVRLSTQRCGVTSRVTLVSNLLRPWPEPLRRLCA